MRQTWKIPSAFVECLIISRPISFTTVITIVCEGVCHLLYVHFCAEGGWTCTQKKRYKILQGMWNLKFSKTYLFLNFSKCFKKNFKKIFKINFKKFWFLFHHPLQSSSHLFSPVWILLFLLHPINDSISLFFSFIHILDVPAPPERPLITYFTSRQVNLSWAHLQDSRNDPVIDFIIEIR